MAVNGIILLLEYCLKNTYFSFQDQFYEQVEGAAMGSLVRPIVANLYMEYLEQETLSTVPQPLGFGTGLWITPLSSTRRSTNKTSFNTSIVLTLPSGLHWRTTRRTALSNQRLMVVYPSLSTGNSSIHTSTYRGIAIITSQLNSVSSTHFPIGPKQCAAGLGCSNKKLTTLERFSLHVNILNGLWTWWGKDLTSLPVRQLMGLITKVSQLARLSPMESKLRVTLSYPTHKAYVKASKRSVVDMTFKPTSKVAAS